MNKSVVYIWEFQLMHVPRINILTEKLTHCTILAENAAWIYIETLQ
jgi:hypothetical protein